MIKKLTLQTLQLAINKALSLDEHTPDKILQLQGKVIEVIVEPLNVHFFITFTHSDLKLLETYSDTPDTIIHSSPLGLIRLSLLPSSKARSIFNDKIRISGDIELGEKVKRLFDELEIDWEGHLAHFTGDVIAYQVGSLVRKGIAFQHQLVGSFRNSITDYLQEELRLFPPKEEVEDFYHDIDSISLGVERLEAQVNLLLSTYEIT